jgi:hypothetical protein
MIYANCKVATLTTILIQDVMASMIKLNDQVKGMERLDPIDSRSFSRKVGADGYNVTRVGILKPEKLERNRMW